MRKTLVSLCSAALLFGGISITRVMAADAKTVEGELVDTHCYSKGGAKGEGHAKCGGKCAASGIPVAVLADGKAWTLATNPKPLADSVGKTVRVTGEQNAETGVITADKVEVKDGDSWKEVTLSDVHHKGEKKEEKKES
jgi:hypothetical protein